MDFRDDKSTTDDGLRFQSPITMPRSPKFQERLRYGADADRLSAADARFIVWCGGLENSELASCAVEPLTFCKALICIIRYIVVDTRLHS